MTKFIIVDWMNKICFKGKAFESFEDAWGFLYETFPNGDEDQIFDDYFVVDATETRDTNYLDPTDPRS